MSRQSEYFRPVEWYDDAKEPSPPRKLTLEEQFARLRWRPVDWGDMEPPTDKPFAVARSQMAAGPAGHVYTVFKLNTGKCVFDLGYRNEWATP